MTYSSLLFVFGFIVFFCTGYSKGLEEGCMDFEEIFDLFFDEIRAKFKVISVTGQGHLYSPGFKENKPYPNHVMCGYILKADDGMHVRIHFHHLDIEVSNGCLRDRLAIREYSSDGHSLEVETICGDQKPYDYVSQMSELEIDLTSLGYSSRSGFNITYSVQTTSDYCQLGEHVCRNRKCIDESLVCDGKDDCGDGTDEESCEDVVLPSTECGRPEVDPVTFADLDRIVGGPEAAYGSWPWIAALQWDPIHPSAFVCGGSLINAQWVLTAAHCFNEPESRPLQRWRIHLGNYHIFKKDPGEQIRYAERIVLYENINPKDIYQREGDIFDTDNDIALIKLNAPVKFTKYVKPVCLADPESKFDNSSTCYYAGWGDTTGMESSAPLKQVIYSILPDKNCTPRRRSVKFNPNTMVCSGSELPRNGFCYGDGGGPLVCETSKGHWSLVGITGEGMTVMEDEDECGLRNNPTVFTKVAVKISWIRKIIESDDDE